MTPLLARPWRARALGFLALLGSGAVAPAQDAAAPQDLRSSEADYVISARVDDAPADADIDDGPQKQLEGSMTLVWRNRSGEAVKDLWFHLYLNAYANNQSLHLTESKGMLRGTKMTRGYGWQDITKVVAGGVDVTDSLTFRVPRDTAPYDRTLVSVDLPAPVESGGEVEVQVEWSSRLPRVRRRSGTKGNFIFLSHWFPKLAVYEGGRGWRAHPFHMNTEFYADYGTFDVTLDLPEEYAGRVAGSGQRIGEPQVADGRAVTRFVAPAPADQGYDDPVAAAGSKRPVRVHGFAWTADPEYVVHEETFRWDEWAARYESEVAEVAAALGKTAEELRGRDVLVRVMVQPERSGQAERHARATMATLFFYGLWYGPYPYSEVTAVDPAWGARAAGGMEYPTIFTCGSRMFTAPELYTPESVTVHEAGHQFWYGLVGNNEPEAAWLDEGFNSFSDSETLFREYGPRRAATRYSALPFMGEAPTPLPGGDALAKGLSLDDLRAPNPLRWILDKAEVEVPEDLGWLAPKELRIRPLRVAGPIAYWRDMPGLTFVQRSSDPRWGDRSGYLRDPDSDPIETNVWDYVDGRSYGTNSYPRTAVGLRSLQAVVGRDAFLRGMRRFSTDWRFRHPYPEDFYLSFQEGADAEIQWYFDDVFRGTGTIDWRCDVAQSRQPEAEGWFRCEDGSWTSECAPELMAEADESDSNDGDDADVDEEASADEGEEAKPKRPYVYDVVLRRRGELLLPLEVLVTFEDGSTERFQWSREAQDARRWWRLPLPPGQKKIASVILDPERRWYLDRDMSNNQWFAEPDRLAPTHRGERSMTRTAHLLQWFMSVGG